MIGIFLKLKKNKELDDYKKFLGSSFAMDDGITKSVENLSLRLFNKKLYELTDDEFIQLMNKTKEGPWSTTN